MYNFLIFVSATFITPVAMSQSALLTAVWYHWFNHLNPTVYVMHQQFHSQQPYALPTLYLCVLYLSENKQRLVPLTAQNDWFL
jgi:hypothetical protein